MIILAFLDQDRDDLAMADPGPTPSYRFVRKTG